MRLLKDRAISNAWIAAAMGGLGIALRLPGLDAYLTADEFRLWTELTGRFLEALRARDWAATAVSGYPGVIPNWLGSGGLVLAGLFAPSRPDLADLTARLAQGTPPLDLLFWLRLPFVLFGALGVALIYLLATRLLPRRVALSAGLFLLLDPFLLAHTRLLNPDGVLAVWAAVSWLAVVAGAASPSRTDRRGLYGLGGLALAGAVLTKSPGLVLLPLLGAWILGRAGLASASWKSIAGDLAWLGLTAVIGTVLLWPALWTAPLPALERIWGMVSTYSQTEHELGNFWLGQPVADPGPLFYPAVLAWRTMPVVLVGVLLYLILGLRRETGAGRLVGPAMVIFVLWFVLTLSISPKKFDRYLLPAFPALSLLAALGWDRLMGLASPRRAVGAGLLLLAGWQLTLLWPAYPSLLTLYNPLVGGAETARRVILVGWGEGLEEAAAWIDSRPEGSHSRVAAWYGQNVLAPFHRGETYDLYYDLADAEALFARDVDYVVTYVNQVQRRLLPPGIGELLSSPIYRAVHMGTALAEVYVWPKPFAHTADRDLGQGMHLLGWEESRLGTEQGTTAVQMTLFWREAQPMAEPVPLVAWIKDGDGEVWHVTESLPDPSGETVPAWSGQQARVHRVTLELPSGVAAGSYRVELAPVNGPGLELTRLSVAATPLGSVPALAVPLQPAPRFGADLSLLGYERIPDDHNLLLDLVWSVEGTPPGPLHYFVHLTDRDGTMLAQQDGPLQPLTPGTLLRRRVRLPGMARSVPEAAVLSVGLYDAVTALRLPAVQGGIRLPEDRLQGPVPPDPAAGR